MRVAQKFAGYSLAEADNLRKAMRQEDPRAHGQGARRSSSTGCERHRLRRASSASSCSTSSSRSPTTRSTRATRSATASSRTRPRTSRRTTRSSTSPPAHERQEQPRQGRGLPRRVPRDGHRGARRPTSTARSSTSPRSTPTSAADVDVPRQPGRDHVRAVGGPQRRRGPGRAAARASATPTARSSTSTTSPSASPEPVLNKRTVESLIKAGAFDSLGHPRQGLLMVFEQIIDATLVRRRERDQGVMSLFGDLGGDERRRVRRAGRHPRPRVRQERAAARSRRRCSASTSATTRCWASRRRCAARSTAAIAEAPEREDGAMLRPRRRHHQPGPQVHQEGRPDGGVRPRGPRQLDRGHGLPAGVMEHGHKLVDDAIVTVKGRVDKRDETRVGFMALDVKILEGLDTASAASLRLQRAVDVAQRAEDPPDPQDPPRPPRRLAGVPAHRPREDAAPGRRVLRRPRSGGRRAADVARPRRRDALIVVRLFEIVRFSGTMETSHDDMGSSTAWQSRWKPGTVQRSPTPISTKWRRWAERSTSECCRRPRKTGCCAPRRGSTTSCTASRSPRSSASAARRAC